MCVAPNAAPAGTWISRKAASTDAETGVPTAIRVAHTVCPPNPRGLAIRAPPAASTPCSHHSSLPPRRIRTCWLMLPSLNVSPEALRPRQTTSQPM